VIATGGCHCKAVRFSCTLPSEPVPALACNCSICSATGFVHVIVPHGDFALERGEENLTEYRFGTGAARHLFCKTCGIKSYYQPRSHPDAWSVNANCLDHRPALAITPFDGKDWEQAKANLDGADAAD
jgi:hypothetical protein